MKLAGARHGAALLTAVLALAACDGGTPAPGVSAPSVTASSATGTPSVPAPPTEGSPSTPSASTAPATTTPAGPPPAASSQSVQLVKSGGLAGIRQTITVQPDGTWRRNNGEAGPATSGRLTAAQRARLQQLLADPALLTEGHRATAGPGRCSDAFEYYLTVRGRTIHYIACGQGDKPAITLKIIELLQSATKGQ